MYRWEMDQPPILSSPNSPAWVAPFVMKTYQMVSDPATDHLISWGRSNNTFIVLDPLFFSHLVLPSNFKHSNFSSFIRQLNTYGFRKVDPDRWEFANEWFLRGQKQLLKNIVRKKNNPGQISSHHQEAVMVGGEAVEEMEIEVERMRREQEEMDKELEGMTRRLETMERRPEQMMEFLCKVVDDPEILPKMMLERERRTRQRQIIPGAEDGGGPKKRLLIMTAPSPSSVGATATASNSARTEEEEGSNSLGVASSSSEVDTSWFGGGEVGYGGGSGGFVGFICDAPAVGLGVELEAIVPPYPFSLLGGDF